MMSTFDDVLLKVRAEPKTHLHSDNDDKVEPCVGLSHAIQGHYHGDEPIAAT